MSEEQPEVPPATAKADLEASFRSKIELEESSVIAHLDSSGKDLLWTRTATGTWERQAGPLGALRARLATGFTEFSEIGLQRPVFRQVVGNPVLEVRDMLSKDDQTQLTGIELVGPKSQVIVRVREELLVENDRRLGLLPWQVRLHRNSIPMEMAAEASFAWPDDAFPQDDPAAMLSIRGHRAEGQWKVHVRLEHEESKVLVTLQAEQLGVANEAGDVLEAARRWVGDHLPKGAFELWCEDLNRWIPQADRANLAWGRMTIVLRDSNGRM